jgi:hypothetical protein
MPVANVRLEHEGRDELVRAYATIAAAVDEHRLVLTARTSAPRHCHPTSEGDGVDTTT